MSFTATGLDVRSRGGNLGGLTASLMFWMRERYHGSSTSETSSRDKWSSAFDRNGLLGCDRSAILIHQPSRKGRSLQLIGRSLHSLSYKFWKSQTQGRPTLV